MKDIMTIAVVNFRPVTADKEANLSRICGFTEAAARRGADLVLFPELCVTGYDFYIDDSVSQSEKIAVSETLSGNVCGSIAGITERYGIYAVFGMAERLNESDASVLYNSAVVSGPEGIIGSYRKIHPFEKENTWCVKGDRPFMFDTPWGPVSVGICYDTYQFPELLRYYVSRGSRLYLNPTAVVEEIPKEGSRKAFDDYYARSLEYGVMCNTVFIASANLTGKDAGSFFGGGSCIAGPSISPFYETGVHYYAGDTDNRQEGIFMETVDLSLAERRLAVDDPFTGEPDYRPDVYMMMWQR